ncbi:MAG TPA: ATP-binding cassette domain-containing protein [Spirochaetota bacterium]|nr:ATP-binding cassette domain-containing protein [Spirochaetota bacterium]
MALLNLQNISLSFDGSPLLDGIDLQIHAGEKISLLGRNGSGKTTLMRLMNGEIEPDGGARIVEKGVKTALLPQEVPAGLEGTVRDVVTGGLLRRHEGGAEEEIDHYRVERALSMVAVDPGLSFSDLSAGMKRRVILGRAIVNDPDILLLDEPTNHLDIGSIEWLENFLGRYDRTIFFVTHDRAFMQKIAGRIIEIDRGRLFDWKCDYATFLRRKDAWLEAEETRDALFDKKLAQEEAWIRKGIKARRTRNEGRVRALMKMRDERAARRERQGAVRMESRNAGQSGKMVIEAEGLSFGYGGVPLIRDFSTRIMRGDRIGIIGPNGCGKSTLIRLLLGDLDPVSGTVRRGSRIETAYFDQLRDTIDPDRTVRQNVAEGGEMIDMGGRTRHVIGYLQDFLFTPARADVIAGMLSGGEKNRLMLAKLFTRPSNFLIMDEPTNDLDIETVELLEELLLDYAGTLILVSHDRAFINNVVTSTLVFEGEGLVREYAGGYDDWLLQRKARESGQSVQPKKPRDKKAPETRKLTFKEKKELESIPQLIADKENRVNEIHAILSNPSFYRENSARVPEMKAELERLEHELEALLLRWEELESI